MGLLHFFQRDRKLSSLCANLLQNPIWYMISILSLRNNADWIMENYDTSVPEDVLIKFIEKYSLKKRDIVFREVIDHIDATSINNNVFYKLVNIANPEVREAVIVSLCHKQLQENQLVYLCDVGTQFECFFELAILYYTKEEHAISLLEDVLSQMRNGPFGYMYTDLLQELTNDFSASCYAKKKLVEEQLFTAKCQKNNT